LGPLNFQATFVATNQQRVWSCDAMDLPACIDLHACIDVHDIHSIISCSYAWYNAHVYMWHCRLDPGSQTQVTAVRLGMQGWTPFHWNPCWVSSVALMGLKDAVRNFLYCLNKWRRSALMFLINDYAASW